MICNFYSKIKGRLPYNAKFFQKIITAASCQLKLKKDWEITVLLVGDQEIKNLNKKFRHKNKITDVLSFSQKEGTPMILPAQVKDYLGDIVISYPQIKRQAKKFQQAPERELALILIHGLLHLLGYNDETQKGAQQMARLQDNILPKIYDQN